MSEIFPLARERQLSAPANFLPLTLTLLLPLFFLTSAFGQATVNENLETAYIYVDTAKGSDSNPGTLFDAFFSSGTTQRRTVPPRNTSWPRHPFSAPTRR